LEKTVVMKRNPPTVLYKYKDITGDGIKHFECMLRKNEIWFSSPMHFNDPFDCRCFFDIRNTREEIVTRKANFLVEREKYSQAKAIAEAETEIPSDVDEWQRKKVEENSHRTANSGMLCLTPLCDNFLMWTHYAAHHKGICIRFRIRDINPETHIKFIASALPIEYVDNCLQINFVRDSPLDISHKAFFTKASRFNYEREWRIVEYNEGEGLKPLPAGIIDAVILGCQINQKDAERVINACATYDGDIEIFRAELCPETYGLTIKYERTV